MSKDYRRLVESECFYIKKIKNISGDGVVKTAHGEYEPFDLLDENLEYVDTYDVLEMLGDVKIDFDHEKRLFRIFAGSYSKNPPKLVYDHLWKKIYCEPGGPCERLIERYRE